MIPDEDLLQTATICAAEVRRDEQTVHKLSASVSEYASTEFQWLLIRAPVIQGIDDLHNVRKISIIVE